MEIANKIQNVINEKNEEIKMIIEQELEKKNAIFTKELSWFLMVLVLKFQHLVNHLIL